MKGLHGLNLLTPFDYGILGLALAAVIFSGARVYAGGAAQAAVTLKGGGGQWEFPLDAAEILTVPGPLGDTVVELRDRRVRILSSPCANQTCVAAGAIGAHGQWIACLPNQVLVSISGGGHNGEEVDAASW
jgi:hypothetical protein